MNDIQYWKIIVIGIAIALILFDILRKKSVKSTKTHVMAFIAMVLVLASILLRDGKENIDWILGVLAVSIGLVNFINIFRAKRKKTEPVV